MINIKLEDLLVDLVFFEADEYEYIQYNVKGGAFALFSLTQIYRSLQVYLTKHDHSWKNL